MPTAGTDDPCLLANRRSRRIAGAALAQALLCGTSLFVASPAAAQCTPSGAAQNCSGNLPGGVQFKFPPIDTLNVSGLNTNIHPAAGIAGVSLTTIRQDGPAGADGIPLGPDADPGGNGASGPNLNVNYTGGSFLLTTENASGIVATSLGGFGGDGGDDFGVDPTGGNGGHAAAGGAVTVNSSGEIQTVGGKSHGILAESIGGSGGQGGDSDGAIADAGHGGAAAGGGNVTVNSGSKITTNGDSSHGIFAQSVGGKGGAGGEAGGIWAEGGGGSPAAPGGSVSVNNTGAIETKGVHSYGIFGQSVGGFGGAGGSGGGLVAFGENGGSAGDGGSVGILNSGSITTHQVGSHAIFAQSVGGGGGTGGSAGGLVALGAGGSVGGFGGMVTVTNNGPGKIETSGFGASGIYAQSIGGGGGYGGASGGLVSIGGAGSATSAGGMVSVTNHQAITTKGDFAHGIVAQSIGGGGGSGGASGGLVSIGGKGGGGGNGGIVTVVNTNAVTTTGHAASALFVQSVGGGGGNGAFSGGLVTVGGGGGKGGTGNTVTVTNSGNLSTTGVDSAALFAQSVGGGGGNGGSVVAAGAFVAIGVGGTGGPGGAAGRVAVNEFNNAGSAAYKITTVGDRSAGIQAQSVGGGGGNGGFALAASVGLYGSVSVAVGGKGGIGGDGKEVVVGANGTIETKGAFSAGINAQSVGGGGGNGGFSVAAAVSTGAAGALGFGGTGGAGGASGTVNVNSFTNITTLGDSSEGIFAQSIGGGGGSGGFSVAVGAGPIAGAALSFGGDGGKGGASDVVTVSSVGNITTGVLDGTGKFSHGISAQSVGGGGGSGGFSVGVGASMTGASLAASFGGKGAGGGEGKAVNVSSSGAIKTFGDSADGIFAQSVGGGGGSGGFSIAGAISTSGSSLGASFGGSAADGGRAGNVDVKSAGDIKTHGNNSVGIHAQSIGGGGGTGGFSITATVGSSDSKGLSVGGGGGAGGVSGTVKVDSVGKIETGGNESHGIFAQSVGGGGGSGGFSISGAVSFSSGAASASSIGGKGGGGQNADTVSVSSKGDISTAGKSSNAIFAQSVGGGGGSGGWSIGAGVSLGADAEASSVGGEGAGGGDGKAVDVTSVGNIKTALDNSTGIFAQSVGGGGGNGAFSIAGAFTTQGSASANTVGGKGGVAGAGDGVKVHSTGNIETGGKLSHGILAQSIGGGGGNGGFSIGAGITIEGEGATNSVGGNGSPGGKAGNVEVTSIGNVTTKEAGAIGIFAQSVAGGGGNGAFAIAGTVATDKAASQSVGGVGGKAAEAGTVKVNSTGDITTGGKLSHGILAQSVGGGGGNGGFSIAGSLSTEDEGTSNSVGGNAGKGGDANTVTVDTNGKILTTGDGASGLIAQSVGGGGGTGGFSGGLAIALDGGATSNSVGGKGGSAGEGKDVTVNAFGSIETTGANATALIAQSIGGGGGTGGFSISVSGSNAEGASDSIGGEGGAGGGAGVVRVTSSANLTTHRELSHGILAQSVAGGGGTGGFSVAGTLSLEDKAAASSIGGGGGTAQDANEVHVKNSGNLDIRGDSSIGIFAQSVGGGGGSGGFSGGLAISAGDQAATSSVGGKGAGGGDGKLVTVENSGVILMGGDRATGILAQSVGGGGGNGGFSLGLSGAVSDAKAASDSVGGDGGAAGKGGQVEVKNTSTGQITTNGAMSYGILAQSVGGGGGSGGFSVAGSLATGAEGISGSVGGKGAGGGDADKVTVLNDGIIETKGVVSVGIFAQSVGGGGGAGGFSGALGISTDSGSTTNSVGGSAGNGGTGKDVTVGNSGKIHTFEANSVGILAQSVGGGGGNGAFSVAASVGAGKGATNSVGGSGGAGGGSGTVTVTNSGEIITKGPMSYGIVAQSVGGGGGNGGFSVAGTLTSGSDGLSSSVGGSGGVAGNGGKVVVDNTGLIAVEGDNSVGIVAQSVGGGGGTGGFAGNINTGGGEVTTTVGGQGGKGGDGGEVIVTSTGSIITKGYNSVAVLAQSVGGGGGYSGTAIGIAAGGSGGLNLAVGSNGGTSGVGGKVTVDIKGGVIETSKAFSVGVLLQGIGGGGGFAGITVVDPLDLSGGANITLGSSGNSVGNGLVASGTNANPITNTDAGSAGAVVQSIGGGGGLGGLAAGLPSGPIDGVDFGNTGTSNVVMTLGSSSTGGGSADTATYEGKGSITTSGHASPGAVAQSIGGGGGYGIFAAEPIGGTANSFHMQLGGSAQGQAGVGNFGNTATVTQTGETKTSGGVSPGVVAQSIGAGGGIVSVVGAQGIGVVSPLTANLGSTGLAAAAGGAKASATPSAAVTTSNVLSAGIVSQSIGGGGGLAGFASIGTQNPDLGVSRLGSTGGGGAGGEAIVSGKGVSTSGAGSFGMLVQSIGGGGGLLQYSGVEVAGGNTTFGSTAGAGGDGGTATATSAGPISTTGAGAHGIVAQSVGGGGGIYQAFDSAGNLLTVPVTKSAAASGSGKAVSVDATGGAIVTTGAGSFGILAQSIGGGGGFAGNPIIGFSGTASGAGDSGAVNIHAKGISATGLDSVAAYGESSATGTKGNIEIRLDPSTVVGGAGKGAGVMMISGNNNTLFNGSLLSSVSNLAVFGTTGNDLIDNQTVDITADRNTLWAKIYGNIDLGTGGNAILNRENSYIKSLDYIRIGDGNLYTNNGIQSVYDIGVIGQTDLTGNYLQNPTGQFIVDLNLDNQTHDRMDLLNAGTASFSGTGPLNFLGIDQLFDRYTISTAPGGMTDAGFDPLWIIDPTPVGFDFNTVVEGGNNLVLFADKPTFLSLVQDPASGTTDDNVWRMADYMDQVEAAAHPVNPMARLINMLRFLDDEEELGTVLTRLTPHYAAHSFDVANRVGEMLTDQTRSCANGQSIVSEDGRCIWAAGSGFYYERDGGSTATSRQDDGAIFSIGGQAPIHENFTIGASLGGAITDSRIYTRAENLSDTDGTLGQGAVYLKYDNGPWFADLVASGGGGRFEGSRNTYVPPVLYVPADVYQDGAPVDSEPVTAALPGIADNADYEQDIVWAGGSSRLGYTLYMGSLYLRPQVEGTARWLQIGAYEETSDDPEPALAAMAFEESDNVYLSGTPALELGVAQRFASGSAVRAYVRGGVEFSDTTWEIPGGFIAAESLNVPPVVIAEDADSPLYRIDAVLGFVGAGGSGIKAGYRGAFGDDSEHHQVFGKVNINF